MNNRLLKKRRAAGLAALWADKKKVPPTRCVTPDSGRTAITASHTGVGLYINALPEGIKKANGKGVGEFYRLNQM